MTTVQKIQLRQSEIKSAISTELDKDEGERDHAEIDRLTGQAKNVEVELRAALVTEDIDAMPEDTERPISEDEQLLELRSRVDFGNYLKAAIAGIPVLGGAELEYNQELGLSDDYFPLEILANSEIETRAKTDAESSVNQQTWIDRVFAQTAAQFMGINFQSVAPGVLSVPQTVAGGGAVQRGRQEDVTASTYTVTVEEMKPSRAAVHGVYSIEDNARLPGLADAIMRDMRAGMTEAIDKKIFIGDSAANENVADITGLQTAAITEVTLSQANKVKPVNWISLFADLIDGLYATSLTDMRVVKSVGTARLWLSTIANAQADNETLAAFLGSNGVSSTTREGIDTNTANGDFGAYISLAGGQAGTAKAAVWNSAQLIRDPYSSATSGEVELTLNYLWNFKIMRAANYKRLKFVT